MVGKKILRTKGKRDDLVKGKCSDEPIPSPI